MNKHLQVAFYKPYTGSYLAWSEWKTLKKHMYHHITYTNKFTGRYVQIK